MKKSIKNITFEQFLRITFEKKMMTFGPDDRYHNAAYVCGWCKIKVYIGESYKRVPEDLRAWFLPATQFEELRKIIEEGEQ